MTNTANNNNTNTKNTGKTSNNNANNNKALNPHHDIKDNQTIVILNDLPAAKKARLFRYPTSNPVSPKSFAPVPLPEIPPYPGSRPVSPKSCGTVNFSPTPEHPPVPGTAARANTPVDDAELLSDGSTSAGSIAGEGADAAGRERARNAGRRNALVPDAD